MTATPGGTPSPGAATDAVAEAAALAERGTPEVRGMAALAAECRGLHLPFDEAVIRRRMEVLRSSLGEID